MKTLAFAILMAIGMALLPSQATPADMLGGVQEQILQLPNDGGQWFLSIFGDADDPQFQKLQGWLQTHDGLASLVAQTHYNEFTSDGIRFRERYADTMPGLPCIRMQNSKGIVTSEFWGEFIPGSAEVLFNGMAADISDKTSWGCLKRRRKPCPQPQPEPVPVPAPTPVEPPVDKPPVVVPPTTPTPAPGFPWILALASGLIGFGVGIGQGFKWDRMNAPAKTVRKL